MSRSVVLKYVTSNIGFFMNEGTTDPRERRKRLEI